MCATGHQAIGLVLLKPIGADTGQETTGLALSLLGCILHKSSLLPPLLPSGLEMFALCHCLMGEYNS